MSRTLRSAAAAGLLAISSAAFASSDETMRRLWLELQDMRDDPVFHAVGFGQGGPYAGWMEELQLVMRDRAYMTELYARCELVPGDLVPLARDYMNRRRTDYTERMTETWSSCFGQ